MTIWNDAVVLITGANGGLGTQFVEQALDRGARKVYATARTPRAWDDARVVPLALDITDPASIARVAAAASDVTILVNNAGISPRNSSLLSGSDDDLRHVLETNLVGQIRMILDPLRDHHRRHQRVLGQHRPHPRFERRERRRLRRPLILRRPIRPHRSGHSVPRDTQISSDLPLRNTVRDKPPDQRPIFQGDHPPNLVWVA